MAYPCPLPPWPDQADLAYGVLVGGAPVEHDSAALLDDGRVIYQYGTTSALYQAYYEDWATFGEADNTGITPYAVDEQIASGLSYPRSTLFRMGDGGLYMSLIGNFSGTRSARIYKSTSGTGESTPGTSDWVLQSTIVSQGSFDAAEWQPASIGRAMLVPGTSSRWVMSVSTPRSFLGVPIFHQSIYSSENGAAGPWTLRHDHGYYVFDGSYGLGQSRQFVNMNDTIVWASTGNVEGANSAYSTDGLAWSETTVGGNSTTADPLLWDGTYLYRWYATVDSGSWPTPSDGEAFILRTSDFTTPGGDLLLDLATNMGTSLVATNFHQQYVVEGPLELITPDEGDPYYVVSESYLIRRGIILQSLVPNCIPVHPDPLFIPYKARLGDLADDFTTSNIPRAMDQQFQNMKVIEQWAARWMTQAASPERCHLLIPYKAHSNETWATSAHQSFDNWKAIERWAFMVLSGGCGCSCEGATPPPEACFLFIPHKDALATVTDPTDLTTLALVADWEFDNFKTLERWAGRYASGVCGCTAG